MEIWSGELVIMACGPTATVLASDLSKNNVQALDLGHIDIQYEWFLHGNDFKPVPGKYTNESHVKLIKTDFINENYSSQIIAEVK